MEPDDAKLVVGADEMVERIAPPLYVPGAVRKARTSKYKQDDGSFILPISFEYKPMTDFERSKCADRMTKATKIEEMKETAYYILSQHVLRVDLEGFEPSKPQSWRAFTCGEIVQEILGIVRGDGKRVEDDDLKN